MMPVPSKEMKVCFFILDMRKIPLPTFLMDIRGNLEGQGGF